jgi:hypothetical protein
MNINFTNDLRKLVQNNNFQIDPSIALVYGENNELVYNNRMSLGRLLKLMSKIWMNYEKSTYDPFKKGQKMDIYSFICLRRFIQKIYDDLSK